MRRSWLLACAGACVVGIASTASAQNIPVAPGPIAMPGTTVGQMVPPSKSIVKPVGNPLPNAVPQVGTPITGLATNRPDVLSQSSKQPPGVPIDMKNVVTPYPNMPKEQTFWEQLENRWFALFQSDTPAQRTNWTPGLARRNKERAAERNKRWD